MKKTIEYKSAFYNGPLSTGDEVVVVAGEDCPKHYDVGNIFPAKVYSFNAYEIWLSLPDFGDEKFTITVIGDDENCEILRLKEKEPEQIQIFFEKQIVHSESILIHRKRMYGRQIEMEEKSLPPKSQRAFEFL